MLFDLRALCACFFVLALSACDDNHPVSNDRYHSSDQLFEKVAGNVEKAHSLQKDLEIDHSRLAAETESHMPPARVLLFSNIELESKLLEQSQLIGIDLPLRLLAYESLPNGPSKLIYNSYDYLASRYGLSPSGTTRTLFESSMSQALQGVDPTDITHFGQDQMRPDGIVTLDSPFDFEETSRRVLDAVSSAGDTVIFGEIDFHTRIRDFDVDIPPTRLILFGAPGPGGKAMRDAPTLGLDAFCQKLLIWEDEQETVHLSFNDLLLIAERHDANKSIALRIIDFRLNRTFSGALNE